MLAATGRSHFYFIKFSAKHLNNKLYENEKKHFFDGRVHPINLDTMTAKILRSALQTNPSHALLPERDKNLVTVKTCSWVIVQGNKNEMMIEIEAFYTDEAGAKKWKGLYKFIVPNATDR